MGVGVYWSIVAAVLILGMIMPQSGYRRKYYIIVVTAIQIFVCGFRYMYLTGDLLKYSWGYYQYAKDDSLTWFSESVFNGGRNAGFQWLEKAVSMLTNGNFQAFLFFLAVITQVAVAILVYKYSPKPWMSYLVWNCMAFYITYDFSAIKQGLAMAILMYAMVCILENRPTAFLCVTLLAGFVHTPALCFLPAYWLMKRRVNGRTIFSYLLLMGLTFLFRTRIVDFVSEIYYGDNEEIEFILTSDTLGGRFFVIVLILLAGFFLKGFQEKNFEGLFHIIAIAAVFQMFSGFNNVFTRLSDYYLQFAVLYIPMIFYEAEQSAPRNTNYINGLLLFEEDSLKVLAAAVTMILIWWYYRTCLGLTIANSVDDYLNFRFMWDVVENTPISTTIEMAIGLML